MLKSIELDAAIELMRNLQAQPVKENTELGGALGRILAEDIHARFPMPPFDKSPFDGFALRSADLPGTLPVAAVIAAGQEHIPALMPGTAIRIFTGAPVPEGADVIVKQEDTVYDASSVTVAKSVAPGTNVIRAGEDYGAGAVLAEKGDKLSPAQLGVLASQGFRELPVYKRPKVVILSTGTELALPGDTRPDWGIYNSSYYSLRGYLEEMGFAVAPAQIVRDEPELIAAAVKKHMDSDADLVITTGGASVGDYDYALSTARAIGAEILLWKIRMKPGGALLVSRKNGKMLLGLSGNPAAALMCMLTVLQPYLRKLAGTNLCSQELSLPLYRDMPKTGSATRLLRGHLKIAGSQAFFEENDGRGNGDIHSFQNCSLIGVIPGNSGPLSAGDTIRVLQLPADLF